MNYNKFAIAAGLGLIGAFAQANGPNLITDGSFENPTLDSLNANNPGFVTIMAGGSFGAWTVNHGTASDHEAYISVDIVATKNGAGNTSTWANGIESGNQAVDLNGTPGPGDISQSFTSPGGELEISYWSWTNETDHPTVGVWFNGTEVSAIHPAYATGNSAGAYTEYYAYVDSTAGSNSLAFDVIPGSDGNTYLDNVMVTTTPGPVAVLPFALGLLRKRRTRTA